LPYLANTPILANVTKTDILQALRNNQPFKGLGDVRAENVIEPPGEAAGEFDAQFDLRFADMNVKAYVEAKTSCTPKQIEQIVPWLSRMKAVRKDAAFALLCPALSSRSQALCLEKRIDFIDLAGNISINVPGKLLIQRTGQNAPEKVDAPFYRDPFSGKSSRILRVLLEKPRPSTLTEIAEELKGETQRAPCPVLNFEVSAGLVSRVLRSLEEQLLIIRKPMTRELDQALLDRKKEGVGARWNPVAVPEPKRLLDAWAEKYKERFRWNLRNAVTLPNPFGADIRSVQQGLSSVERVRMSLFDPVPVDVVAATTQVEKAPLCYAFTSAAATSITAPFVDTDVIEVFFVEKIQIDRLQNAISGPGIGPDLRLIAPYDAGVFLYAREFDGIPVVSDIQAYLDLYARGGRDLKQADYLFEKRIGPAWARK
jgi:hypothetical protein